MQDEAVVRLLQEFPLQTEAWPAVSLALAGRLGQAESYAEPANFVTLMWDLTPAQALALEQALKQGLVQRARLGCVVSKVQSEPGIRHLVQAPSWKYAADAVRLLVEGKP